MDGDDGENGDDKFAQLQGDIFESFYHSSYYKLYDDQIMSFYFQKIFKISLLWSLLLSEKKALRKHNLSHGLTWGQNISV